jgi:hypothetical protein
MLLLGKDNLTACAYYYLSAALGLASMTFVTKDFELVPKEPVYVWIAILAGLGVYYLA